MPDPQTQPMRHIDIAVCTYRRAHIAKTLESLARMELPPQWQLRVIVADNDATPSARDLVAATAQAYNLDLLYLHAPAANIAVARNACLDAATAPWLAFIDDDESVTPLWLKAMTTAMTTTAADCIFGPVTAQYNHLCPPWLRRGDYLATRPVWVHGKIQTGYAGNVVLRRDAPAILGRRFRPELGRSGGEDTLFFAAVAAAGGALAYAPEAIAIETPAPERQSLAWLLRRRFRFGQTHGLLLRETTARSYAQRGAALALAAAKMLYCGLAAACALPRPDRSIFWTLRGSMHAGVAAQLSGMAALLTGTARSAS